jgi:hypothetical protein
MISKKLYSRLKFIEATPLKNRAQSSIFSRRGGNHVVMDEEDGELDKYDTFFDYEEGLADLKPSGEQYVEMVNSDPFIILEEKEDSLKDSFSPITMDEPITLEEIDEEDKTELSVDFKENKTYTDVVGFQFIQCEFIKKDGIRCKRQAPKDHTICSTHKRYIDKHSVE